MSEKIKLLRKERKKLKKRLVNDEFDSHEKAKVAESPYFPSVGKFFVPPSEIVTPVLRGAIPEDADLLISYSDLSSFMECGLSYRLRQRLGFRPQLEPAIGYGKSIHHVMRVRFPMSGPNAPSHIR